MGGSGAGGHFFLLLSGVSQRARLPTSTHLANGHGNKRSDKKFASHVTPARAHTREETTKNVKIDWRRGYAQKDFFEATSRSCNIKVVVEYVVEGTWRLTLKSKYLPFFDAYCSSKKWVTGPIVR